MSEKKPIPQPRQLGSVCPVCGKQSYSKGGVHPQCEVHRLDAAISAKLKKERKTIVNKPMRVPSTAKKCPKCSKECHLRRKKCDCGHLYF